MHAIGFDTYGAPQVLHPVNLPDPTPGAGEVLVRVAAAGVAPVDAMARSGLLAALYEGQQPPFVPGMEIAGTVEALGIGVSDGELSAGTPWLPSSTSRARMAATANCSRCRRSQWCAPPPGYRCPRQPPLFSIP